MSTSNRKLPCLSKIPIQLAKPCTTVGLSPSSLPITASFALPLTLYYTLLQTRVIRQRIATSTSIAQSSQPFSTSDSSTEEDPLLAAVRAQANFSENVPLALVLAGIAELNGGSKKALTYALATLAVARVLHADFGLLVQGGEKPYLGKGRPAGYFGTQGVILGLAGYAAYLVKGYWGF